MEWGRGRSHCEGKDFATTEPMNGRSAFALSDTLRVKSVWWDSSGESVDDLTDVCCARKSVEEKRGEVTFEVCGVSVGRRQLGR